MRKSVALCAVVMLMLAGNAFAGAEARIIGKILDSVTKQPVKDAVVHVSATESKTFEQDYKGEANGTYKIFLIDGTLRYRFSVSAPGYETYAEVFKPKIGDTMTKDFPLTPSTAPKPAADKAPAAPKVDPAVAAYNEGATLYNEGKLAEAAAKFSAAVKAKPDLIAGWEALARTQLKMKDYPNAIESAKKALDIANDEEDMWAVLAEAYAATGDKEKAAEARARLPADASAIFNDAVKLLNAGKDSEAEPLLKKAISIDDKFGPAHYELGMVFVRSGKMAEAKAELEKYIAVDPNGRDVPTAKETLKYLK
jgi:tetratricopeptide (TPR) repeat protein